MVRLCSVAVSAAARLPTSSAEAVTRNRIITSSSSSLYHGNRLEKSGRRCVTYTLYFDALHLRPAGMHPSHLRVDAPYRSLRQRNVDNVSTSMRSVRSQRESKSSHYRRPARRSQLCEVETRSLAPTNSNMGLRKRPQNPLKICRPIFKNKPSSFDKVRKA